MQTKASKGTMLRANSLMKNCLFIGVFSEVKGVVSLDSQPFVFLPR